MADQQAERVKTRQGKTSRETATGTGVFFRGPEKLKGLRFQRFHHAIPPGGRSAVDLPFYSSRLSWVYF
jgi:hypothetical protein